MWLQQHVFNVPTCFVFLCGCPQDVSTVRRNGGSLVLPEHVITSYGKSTWIMEFVWAKVTSSGKSASWAASLPVLPFCFGLYVCILTSMVLKIKRKINSIHENFGNKAKEWNGETEMCWNGTCLKINVKLSSVFCLCFLMPAQSQTFHLSTSWQIHKL